MNRHLHRALSVLTLSISLGALYAQQPNAAPATDTPMKVSSVVMARTKISGAFAKYPEGVTIPRVLDQVVLRAVIATDGTVSSVEMVSGPESLRDVAIKT